MDIQVELFIIGINLMLTWISWGIKTELKYFRRDIDDAHKRLDRLENNWRANK